VSLNNQPINQPLLLKGKSRYLPYVLRRTDGRTDRHDKLLPLSTILWTHQKAQFCNPHLNAWPTTNVSSCFISAAPFLTFLQSRQLSYQAPMTRLSKAYYTVLKHAQKFQRCTSAVQQRVHFLRCCAVRSITFCGKAMTATLQTDCCGRVVSEVKGYNLGRETDPRERLFMFFLSPSMQIMGWIKWFKSSGTEGCVFNGLHLKDKGATIFLKRRESPNNIVSHPTRSESSNTSAETSNVARSETFTSLHIRYW